MKKKGLIISTVVMVIVLIASLTTATYAWFTSGSTATVDNVTLNVGATSKVQIGVGTPAETISPLNFYNGAVTYDETDGWGGIPGLGSTISHGFYWDITKAVGSGTVTKAEEEGAADVLTMDGTYNKEHTLLAANGKNDAAAADLQNIALAAVNSTTQGTGDVIKLDMGIRVNQADVYGTYCKLTVTIPDTQSAVGIIAAMHLEVEVGEKSYSGLIFGKDDKVIAKYDTIFKENDSRQFVFYFMIDEIDTAATEGMEIKDNNITAFSLRFFIDGYSENCNEVSAQYGQATVSLEFDGAAKDWKADPTKWNEIELTANA